ncbi:MAG: tRNA pseudouridine(55) synthase TruB [Nitriliruptorales bacterium]
MDGVLVIDKPAGVGSTDVVRVLRRVARMRKVGHTGTLDPEATGVLVVCLGRATRLVRFLQEGRKVYRAEMVLGRTTTTQDAAGEVVEERSAAGVDEGRLCEVLGTFVGRIQQVPPMVSAVKVGGERLYEKARRGETVEREPRDVEIHDLVLESFEPGELARVRFDVTCSSGTYVRTLAHDIGERLGCGASLSALRRLGNGGFTIDDAVTLEELEERGERNTLDEVVLSLREAVADLPSVAVDADDAYAVATGRPLPATGEEGPVAVVRAGDLLAIYADRDGAARPEAVFVQPSQLAGAGG